MVKNLIHDPILLSMKAIDVNKIEHALYIDLKDTLNYHEQTCVGMAANMIGENKRTIIVKLESGTVIMNNPEIIKKDNPYITTETCLSYISNGTKVRRYKIIKVKYQNENLEQRIKTYKDFDAQIIQHEIDHTNGILI